MAEQLLLKWGTLKGWSDLNENGPAFMALKRYHDEPVSHGVAQHLDTDSQKQALIDCIEAIDGTIWNDWTGDVMTKEEAKKYVLEYKRS